MISYLNSCNIISLNLILMILWHLLILWICRKLPATFFNPNKLLYKQKKWEKNQNFYVRTFRIKKWKDHLPQYISKGGFSKKNIVPVKNIDVKYINDFIAETCRAEWNHSMCSMYFVISFFINSLWNALVFSLIPIIANIPFIIIQRYNRIRLLKIKDKYLRHEIQESQKAFV